MQASLCADMQDSDRLMHFSYAFQIWVAFRGRSNLSGGLEVAWSLAGLGWRYGAAAASWLAKS